MTTRANIVTNQLLNKIAKIESNNNPYAVSHAGAKGLFQVMPHTARNPGFGIDPLQNPMDPVQSRRFARQYLKALVQYFDGSLVLAIMAYNWGLGHVNQWMRGHQSINKIPKETQNYIRALLPFFERRDSSMWVDTFGSRPHIVARPDATSIHTEKIHASS